MRTLAIDPGTTETAFVIADVAEGADIRPDQSTQTMTKPRIVGLDTMENRDFNALVKRFASGAEGMRIDHCVIEMVASYGMAVGREVFETVYWIGRFAESWATYRGDPRRLYRREVKLHLCGSAAAKDPNVRAALLDRYGPGREIAIGTKKSPGPLYGVSGDAWAALGVAVTFIDQNRRTP